MIGATPEQDIDFMFTHNDSEWAIGYSSNDKTYALSEKQLDDSWVWKFTAMCYEDWIVTQGGADEYIDKFLIEANKKVFGEAPPIEEPETELEKIVHITKYNLRYTPQGIVRD